MTAEWKSASRDVKHQLQLQKCSRSIAYYCLQGIFLANDKLIHFSVVLSAILLVGLWAQGIEEPLIHDNSELLGALHFF